MTRLHKCETLDGKFLTTTNAIVTVYKICEFS